MKDITLICKELCESDIKEYQYCKTFHRHLKDVETLDKNKYRFNNLLANKYLVIGSSLKHFKGELANKPFTMEKWQEAYFGILFGWERYNPKKDIWVRRFNTAFTFLSRKNGKTFMAGISCIADFFIRPDAQSEILCCANKLETSKIAFQGISSLMMKSPWNNRFTKRGNSLCYTKKDFLYNSIFMAQSKDTKIDGKNVQIGIFDELHLYPNSDIIDVIRSSQGSRLQPLIYMITTAGFNESPAQIELQYSKDLINNKVQDEEYFYFIAQPNDGIDIFTLEALKQANPNIGVSVYEDYLLKEMGLAQTRSDKLVNFKTKHLNIFTKAEESFISLEDWKSNIIEEPNLKEAKRLIIGIDLSLSNDFSSVSSTFMFNDEANTLYTKQKSFIPSDKLRERSKELRVPLEDWIKRGFIKTSKGKTISLKEISQYIWNEIDKYQKLGLEVEVAFDPYLSKEVTIFLESKGFKGKTKLISVHQGYKTMDISLNTFYQKILNRTFKISKDSVFNWHFSNLVINRNNEGKIKPDKSSQNRKIDSMSAMLTGLYIANKYLIKELEEELELFLV